MPPRRKPVKAKVYDDDTEDGENTPRFRTLIQHKLPDMPAKFTTAYGAPMAVMPQSPMRGKARDIRSAVDRALQDIRHDAPEPAADGDDYENGEGVEPLVRSTVSVEVEPLPEDFDMDGPNSRRPRQVAITRKDPKIMGKQPAWISMATPETRTRSKTPRRATQHPTGDDSISSRSVSIRSSRLASEPILDLDSSRSFGNESALFGDATILSTPGGTAKKPTKVGRRALSEVPQGALDAASNMGNAVSNQVFNRRTSRLSPEKPSPIPEEDGQDASAIRVTGAKGRRTTHNDGDYIPESEDDDFAVAARPPVVKKRNRGRPRKPDTTLQPPEEEEIAGEDEQGPWVVDEEENVSLTQPSNGAPPHQAASALHQVANGREIQPSSSRWSRQSSRAPGPYTPPVAQEPDPPRGTAGQVKSWLRDEIASVIGAFWKMIKMLFWPLVILVIAISIVSLVPEALPNHPLLARLSGLVPVGIRNPFTSLSEKERLRIADLESMFQEKSDLFEKINGVNKKSTDRLVALLPDLVRVDRDKNGNPIVPEDFWHALRSAIHEDGTIMTFDRSSRGDYQVSHDEHWIAIRNRIERDPAVKGSNATTAINPKDVQAYVNMAASKSFEQWLESNKQKIADILGPKMSRFYESRAAKESIDRTGTEKILREALQASELKKVVVTRDEFLRILTDESEKNQQHVQSELRRVQPKIESFIHKALKAAAQEHPPAGMTRDEITTLVGQLVSSAIGEANLGAIANGGLFRLRRQFEKQVNYFSPHGGATIDGQRTTPMLSRKTPTKIFSMDYLKFNVRNEYPAETALQPWQDDGQCFCAVMSKDRRGHNTGVVVSVQIPALIVPTHLVVEHIAPGATVDPDSRPRGIEVWAEFPTAKLSNEVRAWSLRQFPRPLPGPLVVSPYLEEESFVKIGQFEYEADSADPKGSQIYKIPEGLKALMAHTDAVAVRAVSNHGNSNYSCFYRLRLYGDPVEKR